MTDVISHAPLVPESLADIQDHYDQVAEMVLRRVLNEEFAREPVDFNEEGLLVARKLYGESLTSDDVVVDIGTSSGRWVAEAAQRTNFPGKLVGIDPSYVALTYIPPDLKNHVTQVVAPGEHIPLADNSVMGVTGHNMIFRVEDLYRFLDEVKRVSKPGAYVAFSTNARNHGIERHGIEADLAVETRKRANEFFITPGPPAEGTYYEDLPGIVEEVGGLEYRPDLSVYQDTVAEISKGYRLDILLTVLMMSGKRTQASERARTIWRRIVKDTVRPDIEAKITQLEVVHQEHGIPGPAYFTDTIKRGMAVFINVG